MDFDSIFGMPPKSLDDNVLLNPFEKYFNIPSMAVKVCYLQCADFKVIGYNVT